MQKGCPLKLPAGPQASYLHPVSELPWFSCLSGSKLVSQAAHGGPGWTPQIHVSSDSQPLLSRDQLLEQVTTPVGDEKINSKL